MSRIKILGVLVLCAETTSVVSLEEGLRLQSLLMVDRRLNQVVPISSRVLKKAGVETVRDVLILGRAGLLSINGFGRKALDHLVSELEEMGLSLDEPVKRLPVTLTRRH